MEAKEKSVKNSVDGNWNLVKKKNVVNLNFNISL